MDLQEVLAKLPAWNQEFPRDHVDFQVLEINCLRCNVTLEHAVRTCCWITGASLRKHLRKDNKDSEWHDTKDIEEALRHPMFQVQAWDADDSFFISHVVTILEDHAIDSFFDRYEPRLRQVDREKIRAFSGDHHALLEYLCGDRMEEITWVNYFVPNKDQ